MYTLSFEYHIQLYSDIFLIFYRYFEVSISPSTNVYVLAIYGNISNYLPECGWIKESTREISQLLHS